MEKNRVIGIIIIVLLCLTFINALKYEDKNLSVVGFSLVDLIGMAGRQLPETCPCNLNGEIIGRDSCSLLNKPNYCIVSGTDNLGNDVCSIINDCTKCGCNNDYVCNKLTDRCEKGCIDGTLVGECSVTERAGKPWRCHASLYLHEECDICGCPEGFECISGTSCSIVVNTNQNNEENNTNTSLNLSIPIKKEKLNYQPAKYVIDIDKSISKLVIPIIKKSMENVPKKAPELIFEDIQQSPKPQNVTENETSIIPQETDVKVIIGMREKVDISLPPEEIEFSPPIKFKDFEVTLSKNFQGKPQISLNLGDLTI